MPTDYVVGKKGDHDVTKDDPKFYPEDKKQALEKAAALGINPDEPGMMSALRGVGNVEGGIPIFDLFDDHMIRTSDCLIERINCIEQTIADYAELSAARSEAKKALAGLIEDCKHDLNEMKPVLRKLSNTMIEYRQFVAAKRERESARRSPTAP